MLILVRLSSILLPMLPISGAFDFFVSAKPATFKIIAVIGIILTILFNYIARKLSYKIEDIYFKR